MSEVQSRGRSTADPPRASPRSNGPGPSLEAATAATLGPMLFALTAISALITLVDWLSRDVQTAVLLTLVTVGVASVLLWTRHALQRTPPEAGKTHGILSGIVALILVMVFVRAILAPGPQQSAGVALTLILSGFFILSTRWLAAVLAFGGIGWVIVTATSPHQFDAATVILLLSSLAIAAAAHTLRVRMLRSEQSWRLAIQRARDDAEAALWALRRSEERTREEARISASLARVGCELIGSLSTPGLLRRLCELTADVLECEISNTFLLDRDSNTFIPVQTHGHSPEECAIIQSLELPGGDAQHGTGRLGDETVLAISCDDPDFSFAWLLERFGIHAALLIALRRGSDLIGVQTAAHRRGGKAFNASQLRLARDLAQIASMALENARLFEEAERSSRIKSEFVATISHELRTPLNVILGYNELLLEGMFSPLNDEQSEILQRCNRSALQLRELITATLDMSRLEAGRMELDLEEVDLVELVRDIDAETQPFRADKPEVELRWQIADDLARICTDRSKLKVVLKNLINNAIKFTDRGHVAVALDRVGTNGVEIRVLDTGIGIPPDAMQAIFEPFRQADGSSTRRHGGVGLGLYIVRRLLEMIGASIEVESELGKGTTFRIRIEDRWPSQGGRTGESSPPRPRALAAASAGAAAR